MGGRRKNRLIQDVLPIASEFTFIDDTRHQRLGPSAGAGYDDVIITLQRVGISEIQRRRVQVTQRLDQAEPGFVIVTHCMAHDGLAVCAD